MDSERQGTQSTQQAQTSNGNAGRDQPEAPSLIASANSAAERLEKATARAEELAARERLGGRSIGAPQPAPTPVISDQEYARLALSGKFNKK